MNWTGKEEQRQDSQSVESVSGAKSSIGGDGDGGGTSRKSSAVFYAVADGSGVTLDLPPVPNGEPALARETDTLPPPSVLPPSSLRMSDDRFGCLFSRFVGEAGTHARSSASRLRARQNQSSLTYARACR